MKKTLVVAAGLAVLSTSAFASKARMAALSQSAALGSYYLEDNRNQWRSAGDFGGNYVIVEHGTDAPGAAAATSEGGFFREGSSMNYGVYLNSTDTYGNVADATSVDFGNGAVAVVPGRLDLFLSGNSGMDWGVRLGYESVDSETNNEEGSGFDISLNTTLGGANVWLTFVPGTDALTAGGNDIESDMRLGATYDYNGYTLFAEYSSEGGTDRANNEAATELVLGAGRVHGTDNGMFFYDLSLRMTKAEGNRDGVDRTRVPLTFGFETRATSWLSWRVSIQQSLHGALEAGGNSTTARTTTVGAGASLHWGSLQVDGVLQGVSNAAAGAGRLGANDLMSNVSATYTF